MQFALDPDGRYAVREVHMQALDGRAIMTADLRDIPLGRMEAMANLPGLESRVSCGPHCYGPIDTRIEFIRFTVPEKRPYPDEFYCKVARAYLGVALWSDRPAVEISEAHDVPVSTVHRWVTEARKRGFLPPGRAGKVG